MKSNNGRVRTCIRYALLYCLFTLCLFQSLPAAAEPEDAGHNGKVRCPLIFTFDMEYAGTVEEVLVVPGDIVEEGQALARFRLKDEAALAIFQYLDLNQALQTPHQRLTDNNVTMYRQQEELTTAKRLAAAEMGSAEHQKRLRDSVAILRENGKLLSARIEMDKKLYAQRRKIIERKIGILLEHGEMPEYGYIRSTVAGEVLAVHPSLRNGMILEALSGAVTVGQGNPMEVRTRVFEGDVPGLKVGGKASVNVLSLDGRVYEGVITSIDRQSDDMNVDRPSYYGVYIDIPNADGKLRSGFKAIVHFAKNKE